MIDRLSETKIQHICIVKIEDTYLLDTFSSCTSAFVLYREGEREINCARILFLLYKMVRSNFQRIMKVAAVSIFVKGCLLRDESTFIE